MFRNKRIINGKTYYYLEHSYRIGKKVNKAYFSISRTKDFQLDEFVKNNIETFQKITHNKVDHIKRHQKYSHFFDYGNQMSSLEENKILFQLFLNSIDGRIKDQIISEYLRKFMVNNMAMEGGTITYNDATAIDKSHNLKNLKLEGNLLDMRLYIQLKKAFTRLAAMRLQNKEQIKELHRIIYDGIYSFAGEFKTVENWFGGLDRAITASPKDVPLRLNQAIREYLSSRGNVYEFERIIRFHIMYEGVHPFQDGNSRLGRLIMNYQLFKAGYPPLLYEYKRSSAYRSALAKAVNDPKQNTAILKFFYENFSRSVLKFWKPLMEKHIQSSIL